MVLGPGGKGNSGDDQASNEYLSKVDNELKVRESKLANVENQLTELGFKLQNLSLKDPLLAGDISKIQNLEVFRSNLKENIRKKTRTQETLKEEIKKAQQRKQMLLEEMELTRNNSDKRE